MGKQAQGPLKNDKVWHMIESNINPKSYNDYLDVAPAGTIRVFALEEA